MKQLSRLALGQMSYSVAINGPKKAYKEKLSWEKQK